MQEELLDWLPSPYFLVYVSCLLSFCVVTGSSQLTDVVELELHAYRMQQYELNGNFFGSRNFRVQYEAVSLDSSALRRCVVVSWRDLATRDIDGLMATSVGAILIVIPADLDALSPTDKKLFVELEQRLLTTKTDLAVFVTPRASAATTVLQDVESSTGTASSATQQLLRAIVANTFQFTSTSSPSTTPVTYSPQNVIGRLNSGTSNVGTIVLVAHYDSSSAFPGLSVGADSNGSGVVALLELMAILSRFYENPATRPPYNIVFVWTAAGKLNYQGTRHYIESIQDEKNDGKDRVELAICIEAVGGAEALRMHASKEPNDASPAARVLRRMRAAAPNKSIELLTKKINLNVPSLSWEHERFNMKRMGAVTVSRLPSADEVTRRSLLDTPTSLNIDNLESSIRVVAEAVLGYVLSTPEGGFSTDSRVTADASLLSRDAVDRSRLAHWVRQFASRARPVSDEAATRTFAANLAAAVHSYGAVTLQPIQLQEVQVWPGVADRLLAERVKPAVFELVIAAAVCAYLSLFYAFTTKAHRMLENTMVVLRKRI